MAYLKPAQGNRARFTRLIGTGGIGSGILFLLQGDATMGRNESRLGELTGARDFCKLHIIFHYLAALLGPWAQVLPVGAVGADEAGRALLADMDAVGLSRRYIKVKSDAATLYSVCFQYPDSAGGNITTSNSASGVFAPEDLQAALAAIETDNGLCENQLVMAVPEVPFETRLALLRYGRENGSYTVASILAEEAESYLANGGARLTDLLAVNRDEAAALAGIDAEGADTNALVAACIQKLQADNPEITVLITDGARGSYACFGGSVTFTPARKAHVVSTAGAGDAFLAGVLAGLCLGLPLCGEQSEALGGAADLGAAVAGMSVTSRDTIHFGITAAALRVHLETAAMTPLFGSVFPQNMQQEGK